MYSLKFPIGDICLFLLKMKIVLNTPSIHTERMQLNFQLKEEIAIPII